MGRGFEPLRDHRSKIYDNEWITRNCSPFFFVYTSCLRVKNEVSEVKFSTFLRFTQNILRENIFEKTL